MQEKPQDTGMLRPTLIIGAGGTGYDIVARAKSRFLETYPAAQLRQIRFIVFDTDTNHAPVRNSVGELVRLTPDQELVQIGAVPVNGIIDNKSSYPAFTAELDLDALPRVDLTKGAKQVRQLGRMALLFHFERVRAVLLNALTSILNISLYRDAGAERVQSINAFFVSSTCGGTGSGVVLDLAYLVRHLAMSRGIAEDAIFNIGLFLMPDAYKVPQSNRKQIRANACAMLHEVDYFTQHGGFDATYPDAVRVRDDRPPFHIAYLVDDTNERNLTVENADQLEAIMAEAIFLQAGSYVGLDAQSSFDNTPTALVATDRAGRWRSYSMVGAATLRFNAQRMHRACAHLLQGRLVHEVLLKPLPSYDPRLDPLHNLVHPQARAKVDGFLAGAYLRPLRLLDDALRQMPELPGAGAGSMVVNINTDRLANEPRDRIVGRVENACRRYGEKTVSGEFRQQIDRNRHIVAQRVLGLLRDHVLSELDNQESGIHQAAIFLEGVLVEIAQVEAELQQRLAANQVMIKRAESDLNAALENFHKAAQQFNAWGLWRAPLDAARRRYEQTYRQFLNLTLDAHALSRAQILVNELRDGAQHLAAVNGVLRAALEEAAVSAGRELEALRRHWNTSYITEYNIDTPADVEAFFLRYTADGLVAAAQRFLAASSLRQWFERFEQGNDKTPAAVPPTTLLLMALEHFSSAYFQALPEQESLESLLKRSHPEAEAQAQRLRDLVSMAAPFSNYDATLAGVGSDALDQILVLGLADKDNSIFNETTTVGGNTMRTSTFDRNRLSVLDTRHGLPLYALRQYAGYRHFLYRFQAEERRRAGFYCFQTVRAEAETRRLFVLGEALGLIHIADDSSYHLNGQLLGTTLVEAWDALQADRGASDSLRRDIRQWSAPAELARRRAALQSYIQRPRGQWPNYLDRELRSIAQAELDYTIDLQAA